MAVLHKEADQTENTRSEKEKNVVNLILDSDI